MKCRNMKEGGEKKKVERRALALPVIFYFLGRKKRHLKNIFKMLIPATVQRRCLCWNIFKS